MQKILNFASFEAKKFSPSFCFEAKITKSKRSEKFEAKKKQKKRKKWKDEKKRKKAKKAKKKNLNFASLWSKVKNLKQKVAKKEKKFYSEIVKHMWNGSNFALFRL